MNRKQEIANRYVKDNGDYINEAIYEGEFEGSSLFYFKKRGEGHLGRPIFALITDNLIFTRIKDFATIQRALIFCAKL